MADKYRTTGSDGIVERFIDMGTGTGTQPPKARRRGRLPAQMLQQ